MHSFFHSGLFSPRFKTPVHFLQLLLISVVLGLSAARLLMGNAPRGRAGTMSLGMSAKSMAIILYQVLTEQVPALKKWGSLKAYAILNAMEIVFWGAVVYLMIQSQTQVCIGTSCTLGWVIVAIGIVLCKLAGWTAITSFVDFRYYRKNGVPRGSTVIRNQCEDGESLSSVQVQEVRKAP